MRNTKIATSTNEKSKCKGCSKELYIVNKTYQLCSQCNYKRLHGGKTSQEVSMGKQKDKQIKRTKRFKLKIKPRKITGEWSMFVEIWNERPHYCINKNCGKYLGEEPKAIFFSHRKSKGAYPSLRLIKDNIDLLCEKCHYEYDHGNRSKVIL